MGMLARESNMKTQATEVAILKEQMGQVIDNIRVIKTDIGIIKDKLDDNYVKKIDFEKIDTDKETRIRRIELWASIAIGGLYALQFYSQIFNK